MKRILIALSLLLSSATAFAADSGNPSVFQIVREQRPKRVEVEIGILKIHTHNANYRIAWLPFLAPLPYSYPRTTTEVPNPLVLTATEIPQRPHTRPPVAVVTSLSRASSNDREQIGAPADRVSDRGHGIR